jgi:hypothetical protein
LPHRHTHTHKSTCITCTGRPYCKNASEKHARGGGGKGAGGKERERWIVHVRSEGRLKDDKERDGKKEKEG